jgi:hypothetical protein
MTRHGAVNTRSVATTRWLVAVLAFVVLGSGCTGAFLYNRLDTLIPWYLRSRVTLEDRQIDELRDNVSTLTSWHRRSQLTRYSDFLRDLALQVRQPVSRTDVENTSHRIEGYWRDLVDEFTPGAARWLQTLSEQQLDELLASYEEDDEELDEDYCKVPDDKLHRERVKRLTKSVKYWIGSVEDSQEAIIERTSRSLRRTDCDWIESRARWRDELRAALLAPGTRAEVDHRVRELLKDPRKTWTSAYIQGSVYNRDRILDMLVELDASLNEKQRKAVIARLTDLAEDLDELAGARA